jgi:hypothetical protein
MAAGLQYNPLACWVVAPAPTSRTISIPVKDRASGRSPSRSKVGPGAEVERCARREGGANPRALVAAAAAGPLVTLLALGCAA